MEQTYIWWMDWCGTVALKADASLIIMNNLKDFPSEILDLYGIKAKFPDDFLTDIIDLDAEIAVGAFKEMVQNKKNPKIIN